MTPAKKVLVNAVVMYTRIIASMLISLVTVPIILSALGASDYGLFQLVAGVIAMFAFVNNSLTVSSQRYMSVTMGTGDIDRVNAVYNSSFYIHVIIGLVLVAVLEIGSFYLDRLNIDSNRIHVALIIYQALIVNMFLKVASVPFEALINAHEDLVIFSVIEFFDSLLVLCLAFSLQYIQSDKLIFYAICVFLITCFNVSAKYLWCRFKYPIYRIRIYNKKNKLQTKEMFGFAGWNVFGSFAIILRNQIISIFINLFHGTILNASYGIANQINGALTNFSSTIQRVINPQLMKSEGMNDRDRLLRISYMSSKFSVLALCLFAVPLILLMPEVLQLWLKDNIPPYTIELSICILILSILYQFSMGIMSSIQAVGKIRNYQITMGGIILMNIPLAYVVLKLGFPVYYATIVYVLLEFVSLIVRICMGKKLVGMPPAQYLNSVVSPSFLIVGISLAVSLIPYYLVDALPLIRISIVSVCYGSTYVLLIWFLAINRNQRERILSRIRK